IFGIFLVTFNKSDNEKSILELIDFEVIFFGIFIAILWGIMQFLEIIILKTDGITGISYVSIKFTIVGSASLVGYIVILIKNKLNESSVKIKFTNKRSFKYLIFAGFIAWTVGSVLVYTAFEIGRPEILTPIIGINPIFAVLVSLSLGYEKMNATKGIGITLCVLCSLLLVL
ncbi:MAG: EamA family transporter, partial [Candidatus Heimdallarchaeota archaeon]|nr:EamA family transporter [Candidatus Heimdallarchaeota archaeon]